GQVAFPATDTVRKVFKEVKPEYPPEARQAGMDAAVTLRLTVSAAGDVIRADDPRWRLIVHDAADPTSLITIHGEDDRLVSAEAHAGAPSSHGEGIGMLDSLKAYGELKPWLTLIDAAEQAALQWQFEPADRETTCHAVFTFRLKDGGSGDDKQARAGGT